MKQTYIVSGHPRTGTSMMMHALEAGGLEPVWSEARENLRRWLGDEDYDPSDGGLRELMVPQMRQPGFPRMYEGKLIKVMYSAAVHMAPGDYLVVFMRRPWAEIRESFNAFFGGQHGLDFDEQKFQSVMDDYVGIFRQRRDMKVRELWYADVVGQPWAAFEALRCDGWPIDVNAAIRVVKPELRRQCAS